MKEKTVNDHLAGLGAELIDVITKYGSADFHVLFTHLLAVLERYTWCLPSNSQEEIPDISLYDHLRTTAAIAACLYIYHCEKNEWDITSIKDSRKEKFRLVVGDLSGIQSYIFDISHHGAGGVAKRLRARSFYLSMLSEVASHKVLHTFGLPISNIIMASGGKFYILLPNT